MSVSMVIQQLVHSSMKTKSTLFTCAMLTIEHNVEREEEKNVLRNVNKEKTRCRHVSHAMQSNAMSFALIKAVIS